jgi:hypothetical protein
MIFAFASKVTTKTVFSQTPKKGKPSVEAIEV